MTIRSKLTSIFTLIVITILFLFSISVYYFSTNTRIASFNLRLKNRAINTVRRLTDDNGINDNMLRVFDKNTVSAFSRSNVTIYDHLNQKIYNINDTLLIAVTPELLNRIRLKGEIHYEEADKEVVGVMVNNNGRKFVVIASGVDENGLKSLRDLKLILIIGLIITIVISAFAGYMFSGQALKPISNVIKEVENITAKNLNLRVSEGNGTDEIAQLAIGFNKMLQRLEAAFEMQRSFVSNASHELRTPLTAISGQIEVALMNKPDINEYETILQSIWDDIKNMNKLSNGLFDLAQANLDPSKIKLKNSRIDELLWQSRDELIKRHKDYSIHIEYKELPEEEDKLTVNGSEHLLKIAIINVMDNACKYSPDKSVYVNIDFSNENVILQFTDKGIGISEKDIRFIFDPFYRASTVRAFSGHGIGLSLVEKIVSLHNGFIKIQSELNKGTIVSITLPKSLSTI